MKILVANRTLSWNPDTQDDWLPNPYWITAPIELVQLPDEHQMFFDSDAKPPPAITGPYRFAAKDRAEAEKYASEQNWDALLKLAIPERIPPTK